MSQSPVCYFAFANTADTVWLEHLKKESRGIRSVLAPLHDKGFIEVRHEESAKIDYFFEDISGLEKRSLAIFHFSGHGDAKVVFTDSGAASSKSIAGLLARKRDSLQLVFLNACSTIEQVKELHDLGIRAVIATSDQISDKIACEFSFAFYRALANGYDLEGAFLFAVSFVRRELAQVSFSAEVYRGLDFRDANPAEKKLPWGLFIHPSQEKQAILQWKLPHRQKIYFPEHFYNPSDEAHLDVERILYEMAKYHEGLDNPKQDNKITIVQHFPWIISTHIRRLLVKQAPMNQYSLVRLQELVQTYVAGTRFLAFILLSQLWDMVQDRSVRLDAVTLDLLKWESDPDHPFDYFALAARLVSTLSDLEVYPFVNELKDPFAHWESSRDGSLFMNEIRKLMVSGDLMHKNIRDLCMKAEDYCLDFLLQIAFLSSYRLIAVKDIRINKMKHLPTTYTHRIFKWNVFDKSMSSDRNLSVQEPTDSHSILLVKKLDYEDTNAVGPFLNLSPFYIDKSTFSARREQTPLPAIFVLESEGENALRYVSVDRDVNNVQENPSDWLVINDGMIQYDSIWELWKNFNNDLKAAGWHK